MTAIRMLLVAGALLSVARGARAQEPGTLLTAGTEGEWRPLIDVLAAKGTVAAPFTERRFFPFRREALVLTGVLRISRERGLSLQYVDPDPNILIADSAGLLLRDGRGRSRAVPSDSRESDAVASLLPIMRFDMAALYPRFAVRAFRNGADWRFEFTPRDSGAAEAFGAITVGGTGTDVRHLEFKRSSTQRIEIEVGATRTGAPFSTAELKQFFR
jgi:hypothetical protein